MDEYFCSACQRYHRGNPGRVKLVGSRKLTYCNKPMSRRRTHVPREKYADGTAGNYFARLNT